MSSLIAKSVVCDGNSITFGVGGTAYPTQLQTLLLQQGGIPVTNTGVAGKTTQNRIDAFSAEVAPYYAAGAELVFFEQYNSFNPFNGNRTVEQEKALVQTYVSQAQGAGFKVWICSPPPTMDTDINDKITPYSVWLRGNHGFADGFIDFNALSVLTPPGYIDNPTYFSDSVHLTTRGHAAMADLVYSVITARARTATALYANFIRSLLRGTVSANQLTESCDGAGNLVLTPGAG